MVPHPLAVEFPYSFAHHTGAGTRIVLDLLPSADLEGGAPLLRLRNEGRRRRAAASLSQQGDRLRLEATIPHPGLAPGVWRMAVRPAEGAPFRPVHARLLVSRDRPLALLLGPAPRTRPIPSSSTGPRSWSAPRRLVEATLRRLPEGLARRVRATARSARLRVQR